MKYFLIAIALMVSSIPVLAADLSDSGSKTRKSTPADCARIMDNAKQVIAMRDDGIGEATVTASMLRKEKLNDDQYRITLPLLLNFTYQAYGRGKMIPGKDLLTALNLACHSDVNDEWTYF